jgi:MFS family permease
MSPVSRSLGLLSRSPSFTRLLAARAVSLIGDGVGSLALVVHVQQTRGSATAVGILLLMGSLPRLASPLAGAVADCVEKRRLLVSAELSQGALIGAAALWLPPLPVLLALLLAKAVLVAVVEPATHSAIPLLVEDADLPVANSFLGGLRETGEVLGPLLGGILVGVAGVRTGLGVDALTFALSVPLLARIPAIPPSPSEPSDARTGMAGAAWEGLRYLARHRVARAVTVGFFLVGLSGADDIALPFLARVLGAGEAGIGALYASVGGGLIVGYLLLAMAGRGIRPAAGFLLGAAGAGVGNLATGLAPSLPAAVAFQITRGVGIAVLETHLQSLIQRSVPRRLLGRAFANLYGAVNLAAALSLVAGGPLLDATSARAVLLVVGTIGLIGTVLSAVLLRRPTRAERP